MVSVVASIQAELDQCWQEDDSIIAELQTENQQLRHLLSINDGFHTGPLSAEVDAAIKAAEKAVSQLPEMVASASALIKDRAAARKQEVELKARELNNIESDSVFVVDQQIDGVALSNRPTQISMPKSKFLLSDNPASAESSDVKESAFDFESAF